MLLPCGARARATFTRAGLLAATLVALIAPPSRAQFSDPALIATDGSVRCMLKRGDTLYVGGLFHHVGRPSGGFVVLDAVTGRQPPHWPQVAGDVYAAAADGNGGWYIGGSFGTIAGVVRLYAAHLRADGTLDAWDPHVNGAVGALIVRGPLVYLGGRFTTVGGATRNGLSAVDRVVGAPTSWDPEVAGGVSTIAVSRGTVYLQGQFASVGGQPRFDLAAVDSATGAVLQWDAHYTVDDHIGGMTASGSAVYVGSWRGLEALDGVTGANLGTMPSVNSTVVGLAVGGSTLYLGGNFTSVGGQARARLAAIDLNTNTVTPWNPGTDSWVLSLAVRDSAVTASGGFSSAGGASRAGLAALSATTGLATPWDPAARTPVGKALAVGGGFVAAQGVFGPEPVAARENLAAIRLSTGEVLDWNPGTTGLAPGVDCIAADDSLLYVGGFFDAVGGLSRPEIAQIRVANGEVTGWRPFPSSEVGAIALDGSRVLIGGAFTAIGGVAGTPRRYIAALDARTGAPTAWNPGADNMVRAFAKRDSTLYCAGIFGTLGGQPRARLGAVNLRTGGITSWNPGADYEVDAILLGDSTLYAAGSFQTLGGQPRFAVGEVGLATGVATSWAPSLSGVIWMNSLALVSGTVYVAGNFTTASGPARRGAAAFEAATGALTPWSPGVNDQVVTLLADGGSMFMGGDFTIVGDDLRHGLARMNVSETTPPAVTALEPAPGDVLAIGTTHRVSWTATDDFAVQSVDLYVSRHGPAGPWELIAAGAANIGTYDWPVTGPEAIGSAWLLLVARDYAGNLGGDISGGAFSIAASPLAVGPEPVALALRVQSPARSGATLTWTLPGPMPAYVGVIDVQGREVAKLADGPSPAGLHQARLTPLPPGLYFVTLRAGRARLERKLVVLK
jgi:hypothetical protein